MQENQMKKSTIAAAVTAIAIAVIVPFALAQTASGPDAAPPAAASRAYPASPGMMGGSVQGQGAYGPGAMSSYAQGQGGYGFGMMGGDGASWVHEYGGIWALILLVLGFVGLAAWIVKEKSR
jgi:hypothetical protein